MSKDINKLPYDEPTLTKLDIFEKYLQAWLPVFIQLQYTKRAAIWDFFAGSGKDAIGVPGSPLRILRQINAFKAQIIQKEMAIHVLLNEERKRKASELSDLVKPFRRDWAVSRQVTVECCDEDFQDLFRERYDELHRQPNLIFIDQYGVKHVTRDIFEMLVELHHTDFLFFISSSSMKRFAETPEFSAIFPDFSSDKVAKARFEDVHRIMLDYYRSMIPSGNDTRLYPFTLRKGANVYGLIFGSGNLRGVEKFLDLAWNKNALNGEANFDIDEDRGKAQGFLFPDLRRPTKKKKYEEDLEEFIREAGETTNRKIYEFTLERGHPKKHARECVARLRKEKKVDYQGPVGFSHKKCLSKDARIVTIRATENG